MVTRQPRLQYISVVCFPHHTQHHRRRRRNHASIEESRERKRAACFGFHWFSLVYDFAQPVLSPCFLPFTQRYPLLFFLYLQSRMACFAFALSPFISSLYYFLFSLSHEVSAVQVGWEWCFSIFFYIYVTLITLEYRVGGQRFFSSGAHSSSKETTSNHEEVKRNLEISS